MLDFLKKLLSSKGRDLTVVVFDDDEPESSTTYELKPEQLIRAFYGVTAVIAVVILLLVMFTPLGALVYNQEDEELRAAVIEVRQKVEALRDSLSARDMLLSEIQQVMAFGVDTTFEVSMDYADRYAEKYRLTSPDRGSMTQVSSSDVITQNEIIFSGVLNKAPEFPASYPVDGTLTRGYSPEAGHYGIDIATKENTPFRSVADGAVVNHGWTINYGYVLHIQHSNGLISVYKHASNISKTTGDIVLKGDILGKTGDTGVLSTGPHLHVEVWKNGVPQNPISYLIKS